MKSLIKKLFSAIMVATMVLCIVPFSELNSVFKVLSHAKVISEYSVGDIIELGSYPQSRVTDSDLLSKLNSLSLDWISYGYYSGTGHWADGQMKPSDYMKYTDVNYKGVKYRAVTFNQYRPGQTGGLNDADSSVQDEKGYLINQVYWFAYEPIKWKVLDPAQGLVMSDIILDAQAFNNTVYYDGVNYFSNINCVSAPNYYDTSSIRAWLNSDFLETSFNFSDSKILNGEIFLISSEEARNRDYGFNPSRYDNTLQSNFSDYSVCQGLPSSSNGYAPWYFRSKGQAVCHGTFVNEHGYIYIYNGVNTILGIKPLAKLNLNVEIPKLEKPTTPSKYFVMGREFEENFDYYSQNLSSSEYDPVLSNIMAAFSKAIYSEDNIISACRSFGFSDYNIYDYYGTYNPHTCGYSIAFKKSDYNNDIICMVSVRGSQGLDYNADWIGNFEIITDDEKHIGFSYPANRIYKNIQNYLKNNGITSNVKYFITGHSRGAAVANLLSVKLIESGVTSSNVYNYNYACPDITCAKTLPTYDNIFNLCNREDIVPFVPGVFVPTSSGFPWKKYGNTYWFTKDAPKTFNPFADHDMDLYLEFFDQQSDPTTWGKSFIDKWVESVNILSGKVVKVFCPVNVIISDNNGKKIASVIDGKINYYDSKVGDVLIFTDGDKKVIYISGDHTFDVNLIGTDNGEMTYSVEKINVQTEEILESVTFTNVKLENDKHMFSTVKNTETTEDIELFVIENKNGETIITHTIDALGNEYESYWRNTNGIRISPPSTTAIKYGDILVLQLEEVNLTKGIAIEWIADGSGLSMAISEDQTTCYITSVSNGNAIITAKLVDKHGKSVTNINGEEIFDKITVTSKAGFFQKIISLFKNLFRINRKIY